MSEKNEEPGRWKDDEQRREFISKANEIVALFDTLPDEICDEIVGYFFTESWQEDHGRRQTYISLNPNKKPPYFGEEKCCGFRPTSYNVSWRAKVVADWYSGANEEEVLV